MADNVAVTAGSGTTIAADDIGGVKHQRVKVSVGADGEATDLDFGQGVMAASLPIVVASDQSAIPVSGPLTDTQIRATPLPVSDAGGSLTVDGPVTDTQLRATPVPVSDGGASLTVDGPLTDTQLRATAVPVSGTVTVGSITAGTNTIGAVLDAGSGVTISLGISGAVVTSADMSTATVVTDAPTSGQKLVISDVVMSIGATAMQVDLEEETSGTVFFTFYCAANTSYHFVPRGKWKLPTANKKLAVDTSAAGAISVTVLYHSEA